MNGESGRFSHQGSRVSFQGSKKSASQSRGGSFEPVPMDEDDESNSGSQSGSQSQSEGSRSVYSDDESSYESDLETSKESTHQTFNIAKKESNRVRVWRTVLSGMLVATAATVIVTTYIFLTDNEENEFISAVSGVVLLCLPEVRKITIHRKKGH